MANLIINRTPQGNWNRTIAALTPPPRLLLGLDFSNSEFCGPVGHYPNTALFNPPPPFFFPSGEWLKLCRKINYGKREFEVPLFLPQMVTNFPEGLLCPMPRRPLMLRAALLRRSCDGVAAATELRRPAPSRSFCASRLDATRWMRSQHHSPPGWFKFQWSWPTVLGHPPDPVIQQHQYTNNTYLIQKNTFYK